MALFVPNPGFVKEIMAEPDTQAAMEQSGAAIKANAERYADRIMARNPQAFVVVTTEDGTFVANTDYGGHLDEWGSATQEPNASLRRGAMAAGVRVEETPK